MERTCGAVLKNPSRLFFFFLCTELAEERRKLLKSAVSKPQLRSMTGWFSFVAVVSQTFNAHSCEKQDQTTGATHPSGKKALMILSPRGLIANSGILWKSSRLQTWRYDGVLRDTALKERLLSYIPASNNYVYHIKDCQAVTFILYKPA